MGNSKLKERILELTKEYAKEKAKESKEDEKIRYAGRVFDEKELCNLVDASLEFWLTEGRYTAEFEKKLAGMIGVKYANFVNSGSSADLLAFSALTSYELGDRRIKRGDEVITVACSFPTTISPIIQYGAIPVFVDVTIPEYNINVDMLEDALSSKTKAVMIAHTLGNPFNLQAVKDFCRQNGLWLIEDNCDALGAQYYIDGEWKMTGSVGDISTNSFYPAHHITTGEGGAVCTSNPELQRIIRSLRDWGRDCACPSGRDNSCGHRFDKKWELLPEGYDHKYVYSRFGYNLKATDLQAAIGVSQLDKLPSFVEKRRENHKYLKEKLEGVSDKIILPEHLNEAKPSWFGFVITLNNGGVKNKVVSYLEENGIQTRSLFSGNIISHPCFDPIRKTELYRVVGKLTESDKIVNDTFWVGVYPGLDKEKLDKIGETVINALKG